MYYTKHSFPIMTGSFREAIKRAVRHGSRYGAKRTPRTVIMALGDPDSHGHRNVMFVPQNNVISKNYACRPNYTILPTPGDLL